MSTDFGLEQVDFLPLAVLVGEHADVIIASKRYWVNGPHEIGEDQLVRGVDVVFRSFRVSSLRAFPDGADIAR